MTVLDLAAAGAVGVPEVGGKAASLARLLRAGFAVPHGFVIPAGVYRQAAVALGLDRPSAGRPEEARRRLLAIDLPAAVIEGVGRAVDDLLEGAGSEYVAVRSSAVGEDGAGASAGAAGGMAVLVQRFVDAEVSGVMFTGDPTVIEGSWGVGELLVSGRVAPDSWRTDDSGILARRAGRKITRSDRRDGRLVTGPVAAAEQAAWCLADSRVQSLHVVGRKVSSVLGGARDIEWVLADGTT
ncbi:hypothetical protein GCM10010977_31470 [Citricoccus zhacaiensis]|uniref:Pyruvate phosphate dikinase AMP/ATP-binding domain-containing protein n=1 Tax=Citricoccus zhacaiensis TaxID=489142 RepID=A0ABQ2MBR9_9MICC|nr:PEP/pyruvate-binding domain-containing protein [Citricoccus zhacaiensis]GGO49483.1 hypothetical protein GCM10010977_31470 [Citricoccus zhacaiensis]